MTRALAPQRQLNTWEMSVLRHLLDKAFPGREELKKQLCSTRVAEEYPNGDPSVVLSVDRHSAPPAPVRRRIPIEAEGLDDDGVEVHILLHVLDGYLCQLELYRVDRKPVSRLPDARSLRLFSLDDEPE